MASGLIPDLSSFKFPHVFYALAFSIGSWIPGFLFFFVFHRHMFLTMDLARLLLISFSIFLPAFAIDLLISSMVFTPVQAIRESLTTGAVIIFLICFIPTICLCYFLSLPGRTFLLLFMIFQIGMCLSAVIRRRSMKKT